MSAHVLERLSALLDGELSAPERDSVEVHLRTCAACSGHLEVLRAVDAGTRALSVSAPPGYFEALPGRVRARLEGAPRPRTFRLPVWTWAVAAALLVAVVTPFVDRTPPASRAPDAPAAVEYPAPAAGAPAPALPDSSDREEPAASRNLAAPKDDTAKLRKQATAEDRADRQVPAAEAPRLSEKKEMEAKAYLQEAQGERERSVESAGPRKSGPGGPSAQQQAPLQAQAAPAYAPPPAARPAESAEALDSSRDESVLEKTAPRGTALGRTAPAVLPSEERSYQALLAPVPHSLTALRERREAWRSFSVVFRASPRADEARVRVIETGAEAWRLGADPADLARVREDATAYLDRPDAAQGARVRALLESLAAETP